MPLPRMVALLLLPLAGALLLPACAGQPRQGDIPSTQSYVAVPNRGGRTERAGRRAPAEDAETRRNNSDVLVELGQRYYARGEYEIALEKLQSALTIDPTSASAHTVAAILYETINDGERAADHYQRSLQHGGRNGDVLNNYGSWLCRQRRYSEAEQYFRRAMADPFYRSPESALANAGTCALAAGNYEQAGSYLRQVLEARPEDDQALLGLAELAFREQDLMRARAFLQRAEARAPLSRSALELAVQIEEGLGDSGSAAAYRARLSQAGGG